MKKIKTAFTLAEVLITLGIIGVVAAMTIPVIVEKYNEHVTVNKLKKMYSVLNNAYNMYKNDEGFNSEIIPYTETGAEASFKILKPYLNISKDCGANGEGCFYMKKYQWLNGTDVVANYGTSNLYYKILLSDGSSIAFRGAGEDDNTVGRRFIIFYDVNGVGKPNIRGKDLFEFVVYNNKVAPAGDTEEGTYEHCLAEGASGSGCTYWVIFNENLDYLHCKGLSWNGPTSCKDIK